MSPTKSSLQDNGDQLKEYRSHLILAEQKAQEDFDKTILTLSGGALGISFAFVKDIIGPNPITNTWFLIFAWISWGLSVTTVLLSFFTSHLALRQTINQADRGEIYSKRPGGCYDIITEGCNLMGFIFFSIGVALMIIFVWLNLGG